MHAVFARHDLLDRPPFRQGDIVRRHDDDGNCSNHLDLARLALA
jgi:hypothetical protein